MTLSAFLYRHALIAATPLMRVGLAWRMSKGKEDGTRLAERRGIASRARPAQRPFIWCHGASVGESMALLKLIQALTERGAFVLLTTGTVTSARLVAARLPPNAMHQYRPSDNPLWVRRFLDYWRPDLVIGSESDFWPNMMAAIHARSIPMVMVNARISPRSCHRWQRFARNWARELLAPIKMTLAQSQEDARRLQSLGASPVLCVGNLKFAADPPSADPAVLGELSGLIGTRPVWLMASTHPGEDQLALQAHQALVQEFPDLLTVIAPRHAARGGDIAVQATRQGLSWARRSQQGMPQSGCSVYIADSMGEMGIWYRLAPVACIGGSFVPMGGHNPLEAARLGCAILHGPDMSNAVEATAALHQAGSAMRVEDERGLAQALRGLLTQPARARQMGQAAHDAALAQAGVGDRVMQALAPILSQIGLPPARGAFEP